MESGRVLGQNHIIKHFENAIKMGKISHAYIINGEEGSGKLRLAVHFAKALQCQEGTTGTACGQCKSCKQTDSGNQPDIKYIAHEKSGIGVDEIREQINDDIVIKPYSSRYKVYIVPDSEKMTVQAQNALLKTIEEPPEYAIIILLTTNADTFLQTILSRCVLLNIRPVKEEAIKNQLMSEYGVGDYEAKVAATFANGNPGKAIKLATSEDFKELKKQINEYFSLMRMWFRDILMYKATGSDDSLIFQDDYIIIRNMAEGCSFYDIDIILKSIDQAEKRIGSNVNFDASIEVLFLVIKERIQNKRG